MEPSVTSDQGNSTQEIQCIGKDTLFSFPVFGSEVVINASKIDSTEANTASNKVRVSQISKYSWEEKFYHGNLVTCNSNFVAYNLKRTKEDKNDQIRVLNHQTSIRGLVQGPKKDVVDICFESVQSNRLACVDSEGTLFLFNVEENKSTGKIEAKPSVTIHRTNITDADQQHLVWAPYLLSSTDSHESLIAVSDGTNAEVYNLKKIINRSCSGSESEDESEESEEARVVSREDLVKEGGVRIIKDCHTKTITCLALSPDTNVLVTCSLDGQVKFWSLGKDDDEILHEWIPHDGQPVTTLLFCDNLLEPVDETPFWRFLITGTCMSSVLKVWCAVEWKCMQTIEFAPYIDQVPTSSPCMKLALDISAKFLILADIHRPVLYICHLSQLEKDKLSVVSVTEFILKDPLLSFTVLSAKERATVPSSTTDEHNFHGMVNGVDRDADHSIEDDIDEDGTDKKNVTSVKLFAIQKREAQRLVIKYSANHSIDNVPSGSFSNVASASSQEDLLSIKDGLSDIEATEGFSDKILLPETNGIDGSVDSSITAVTNITVNGNYDDDNDDDDFKDCDDDDTTPIASVNQSIVSSLTSDLMTSLADTVLTVKEKNNGDVDLMESTDPLTNDLTSLSLETSSLNNLHDAMNNIHDSTMNNSMSASMNITSMNNTSMNNTSMNNTSMNNTSMNSTMNSTMNSISMSSSVNAYPNGRSSVNPLHNDSSIIMAVSTPKDERQAIYTRNSNELDRSALIQTTPTAETYTTPTLPPLTNGHSSSDQLLSVLQQQQRMLSNQQQVLNNQQQELKEMKIMMKQLLQKQTEHINNNNNSNNNTATDRAQEDLKVCMQLWQKNTNKEVNKVCSQKLDQFTKSMDMCAEQREKHNMQVFGNMLNNTIALKVENTIKQEMKPLILTSLEKLHAKHMDKVQNQVAQILNDKLSSATGILQGTIPQAFTECFTQIILPGFEKALRAMFSQVDQLFRQGTGQYLEHLSKHMESKRQKQQESENHLQELVQSFQATADATADRLTSGVETNLEALMQKHIGQIEKMQSNLECRVAPSIAETVSTSLRSMMEDFKKKLNETLQQNMIQHNGGVPFQTQESTEKTEEENKAILMKFVDAGQYNKAFEEALTAANLSLVMFLCKQIEPSGIFQDPKCEFTQPIIMSLIQQLSVNLCEETETKRRYLEESIMALDKSDDITREHLPIVLQGLNEQLSQTVDLIIRTEPKNEQLKPLKMLLMASRSLLHEGS